MLYDAILCLSRLSRAPSDPGRRLVAENGRGHEWPGGARTAGEQEYDQGERRTRCKRVIVLMIMIEASLFSPFP